MFRKKPKADDILSACLLDFFSKGLGPEYEGVFHGKPYSLTRNLLENLYFTGFINGLMLIVLRHVLPSKGIMTISVTMSIWERVLEEFFGRATAIRMKQIHHAHATDSNGPYKEGTLDAATYFGLDYDLLNSNFSDKNLDEAKKELKKDDKLKKFLELTLWKRVASGEALSVTEVALGDDNNANSFEKNKEKKSSKEKTEKNRKSDFKSKRDKSRTEEKTKDKLSVDFSLLGKNKENYNRKTRSYWSEEPTKHEVLLKNSQQESAKEVKRMFSIIFSKFPNNNLPIWIDLIRFPFVILIFFSFFALIGAFLSLVRLVSF